MPRIAAALLAAATYTFIGMGPAYAEPVNRQNWIPTGNYLFAAQEQLGDMWMFTCRGGTVSITVDTVDDNGDNTSRVDPRLSIFDGDGNLLATPDDTVTCSVPPACGFSCPQVINLQCGRKDPHAVSITSAGTGLCDLGGEYRLTIEVRDKNGVSQAESKIKLGGGAKLKLPRWLDPSKGYKQGPLLDDEKVPLTPGPLN